MQLVQDIQYIIIIDVVAVDIMYRTAGKPGLHSMIAKAVHS